MLQGNYIGAASYTVIYTHYKKDKRIQKLRKTKYWLYMFTLICCITSLITDPGGVVIAVFASGPGGRGFYPGRS